MKKIFLFLMMLTFASGIGWATDLYILGMVNGNGSQPNQGVKMTYDDKMNIYTADIWVIGNSDNNMGVPGTWFAFTTVIANDNDNGGWSYVNDNRYSPSPEDGNYYWLTNGPVSNVPLTKQNNDKAFLIPAGLYRISVSGDLSSFNLDEVKDLTPTITPESGNVPVGTFVTTSISEDFDAFIAGCNPVVNSSGSTIEITPPDARLYVDGYLSYSTSYELVLNNEGETTVNAKCALYVNGNDEYAAKTATKTYNVYSIFTATIASGITGGTVSLSATDPSITTLQNLIEGQTVNVYVTPMNNREIETLTYTPENGSTVDLLKGSYNEEEGCYSFNMPKANVTINASFKYVGPEPTETTYELITSKTANPFEAGAKYLIVNESYKKALGMPVNTAIDITIGKDEHFTSISSDSDVAQFVLGGSDKDGWSFQSEFGYLKLESNNELSQNGSADDTWTITFDDYNNATITSNATPERQICYQSKGIFSTMTSGGKDYYVQLYKEVAANSTVTVTGIVTDEETEATLEDVAVTLIVNAPGKADVISYTATTDDKGIYSMDITPVEGATYDMTFEKEGYVSKTIEDVDITKPQDVALELDVINTGISNINANNVVSVKYVNSMGQTSNRPFDGINIVVTRYTDGHTSTSKIIK